MTQDGNQQHEVTQQLMGVDIGGDWVKLQDSPTQLKESSTQLNECATQLPESNTQLMESSNEAVEAGDSDAFLPQRDAEVIDNTGNGGAGDMTESEKYKELGLYGRLKVDKSFQRKLMHTIWLYCGIIGLGWMLGITGPTFPDLRLITGEDLDTASWLFSVGSMGYLFGCFIGGVLYDRYNKLLVIVISLWIMALATVLVPWCESFPLMLVTRLVQCAGGGGFETGGNTDLLAVWGSEGQPFMQALNFCFGLGSILSPLLAEPFLARRQCVSPDSNLTEQSLLNSSQPLTPANNSVSSASITSVPMYTRAPAVSVAMMTEAVNTTITCQETFSQTHIHIAYFISGLLFFSCGVPFLIMYIRNKQKNKKHITSKADGSLPRDPLSRGVKLVLLMLLCCLMFLYCGMEDSYSSFLMTFCISQLGWDKAAGSFATSTFWTASTIGRFLGIFFIKLTSPGKLISIFTTMITLNLGGFLLGSILLSDVVRWIFIVATGFSMSVVFPCVFSWTEKILPVTGKVSGVILVAGSAGAIFTPVLIGNMMENVTPLSYLYVSMGLSASCQVCSLLIHLIVKRNVKLGSGKGTEISITTVES